MEKQIVREAVREEFKYQQKKAVRNVLIAYAIAGGTFALNRLANKTGVDQKVKRIFKEVKEGFMEGFEKGYNDAINR